MSSEPVSTSRVERLCQLYLDHFGEAFDPGEFLADDFYAFQVIERAFQVGSRNRDLHSLAILMHAERKSLMETGLRRTLDVAKKASLQPLPGPQMVQDPQPGFAAIVAATPAASPTATAAAATASKVPERRSGKVRMSGTEITKLSAMRGLYRKHFGQSFDVEEFAANDLYAKVVLGEITSNGPPELIELARHFLDAQGKPRMHRRKGTVDLDFSIQMPAGAAPA